jgi:hypothetical protein
MTEVGPFEKARRYIESHAHDTDATRRKPGGPCITISRQTGAGADRIGEKLIDYFQKLDEEFILFDKNLIDKILTDNDLPQKISEYFPEDKVPAIRTAMNELFGIHPPIMKLLRESAKTILQLARMGNVIIVGRAANIITANLQNSFHVRLIAPVDARIKNMQTYYEMSAKEATEFVEKEDKARKNFVSTNYHKDGDDPTGYHLIVNVQLFTFEEAAAIIGGAVVMKFPAWFQQGKA